MAFQTRQRDPLFDAATQAALERRAQELIGLALIAAGVLLALALASYTPSDPSFLGTSSEAPQNWLGYFGAYIAAPLNVIMGRGAWALVIAALGWGGRLTLHKGGERIFGRAIFLPIFVALAAVYAASHPPGPDWGHSFGLGGLFGDMALGVLLGLLPVDPVTGLRVMAAGLALGMVAMGLFSLGTTRAELRAAGRFMGLGVVQAYDQLAAGMGRGAARARHRLSARVARRGAVAAEYPLDDGAGYEEVFDDEPASRPRIALGSVPSLGLFARRGDKAPVAESDWDEMAEDVEPEVPGEDRVRARINDAIRARLRTMRSDQARARREPPVFSNPQDDATPAMMSPTARAAVDTEGDAVSFDPDLYDADDDTGVVPDPVASEVIPRFDAQKPAVEHNIRRSQPSRQARAEAQPSLQFGDEDEGAYDPPPLTLLRDPAGVEKTYLSDEALQENARMLETVLDDYGVKGDIVSVRPGPVVTMYELEPAPGLKASRVIGLADDIARSMSALSARVSTVPGRSVIGIELPNERREMVLLREILSARDFGDSKLRLPLALGKDIGGEPVVANLAKMPHLLIAGTTGSGKSVAINTMILSLLYKLTPDECRLIMIDPKMLELSVYDGIPHLLSPVVTDPKKAVVALKWVVAEMEDRYRKMSKMGVRNIEGYNGKVRATLAKGEMFSRTVQTGFDDETGDPIFETEQFEPQSLPYIVVIVDEMADLMMVAGKEIEACIQRLAQMARASGIHLIMATQRPSVDVITGTIKANFPTRISFQVTSKVDSRTILGEQGAEQLLGQGDMLYMAGGAKIVRVHGPFVSDEEVEEVVTCLKANGPPDYVGGVADGVDDEKAEDIDLVLGLGGNTSGEDALYDQAVQVVIQDRKCSTSYIQRKLAIGYNKAARLVEQMEDNGLVTPANHVGKREILVPEQ
ncbi:MAG: DNA translocase FtsK [Qingshengfaniella sp.]